MKYEGGWGVKLTSTQKKLPSKSPTLLGLMYNFHYDCIKNKYDNKSKLLLTDSHSLMHEIKTEDVYEDFRSYKEMFDFSNNSTEAKYHDNSNKLVIAKMKVESAVVAYHNNVMNTKTFC